MWQIHGTPSDSTAEVFDAKANLPTKIIELEDFGMPDTGRESGDPGTIRLVNAGAPPRGMSRVAGLG